MKWQNRIIIGLVTALLLGGAASFFWRMLPEKRSLSSRVSSDSTPDAFVMPAESATDTSLALFMHQMEPGNVLTEPLFNKGMVSLASTAAKTGEASLIGKALRDGLFLYLNRVNAEQSNHARVSLDQRDDAGQVLQAVQHVGELLEDHHLFFSSMGDNTLEKVYIPLLSEGKVALIFPVAGMRPSYETNTPAIFFRPSYIQEVSALVYYALEILKKKKVGVFFEESEWGREAKEAVEHALATYGIPLAAAASYQPGTVNVQSALRQMQQAEPHVVICVSSARPAYNFIREAINHQLHYVSFLGISRLTNIAEHLRTSRGTTLVTSSVVPNPHNSQLPIVDLYRQDMQRYLPNKGLSTHSLEGYINSMLFTFYLEYMSPQATVGDLISVMKNTKNLLFKGLDLDCSNNTLSHTIWINEGSEQQWHEYTVRNA